MRTKYIETWRPRARPRLILISLGNQNILFGVKYGKQNYDLETQILSAADVPRRILRFFIASDTVPS